MTFAGVRLACDDYDPDLGPSYAWQGEPPVCPECGDPLLASELVVSVRWDDTADLEHRACGWEGRAER